MDRNYAARLAAVLAFFAVVSLTSAACAGKNSHFDSDPSYSVVATGSTFKLVVTMDAKSGKVGEVQGAEVTVSADAASWTIALPTADPGSSSAAGITASLSGTVFTVTVADLAAQPGAVRVQQTGCTGALISTGPDCGSSSFEFAIVTGRNNDVTSNANTACSRVGDSATGPHVFECTLALASRADNPFRLSEPLSATFEVANTNSEGVKAASIFTTTVTAAASAATASGTGWAITSRTNAEIVVRITNSGLPGFSASTINIDMKDARACIGSNSYFTVGKLAKDEAFDIATIGTPTETTATAQWTHVNGLAGFVLCWMAAPPTQGTGASALAKSICDAARDTNPPEGSGTATITATSGGNGKLTHDLTGLKKCQTGANSYSVAVYAPSALRLGYAYTTFETACPAGVPAAPTGLEIVLDTTTADFTYSGGQPAKIRFTPSSTMAAEESTLQHTVGITWVQKEASEVLLPCPWHPSSTAFPKTGVKADFTIVDGKMVVSTTLCPGFKYTATVKACRPGGTDCSALVTMAEPKIVDPVAPEAMTGLALAVRDAFTYAAGYSLNATWDALDYDGGAELTKVVVEVVMTNPESEPIGLCPYGPAGEKNSATAWPLAAAADSADFLTFESSVAVDATAKTVAIPSLAALAQLCPGFKYTVRIKACNKATQAGLCGGASDTSSAAFTHGPVTPQCGAKATGNLGATSVKLTSTLPSSDYLNLVSGTEDYKTALFWWPSLAYYGGAPFRNTSIMLRRYVKGNAAKSTDMFAINKYQLFAIPADGTGDNNIAPSVVNVEKVTGLWSAHCFAFGVRMCTAHSCCETPATEYPASDPGLSDSFYMPSNKNVAAEKTSCEGMGRPAGLAVGAKLVDVEGAVAADTASASTSSSMSTTLVAVAVAVPVGAVVIGVVAVVVVVARAKARNVEIATAKALNGSYPPAPAAGASAAARSRSFSGPSGRSGSFSGPPGPRSYRSSSLVGLMPPTEAEVAQAADAAETGRHSPLSTSAVDIGMPARPRVPSIVA
eukprot:tig00001027_g6387.t1